MLKKSMGIGLLCLAGQAYSADITVTTTEDVVKDDDQCSLREAIDYINKGMSKKGYMGCGGEGANNIISLKEKTTYNLNSHIAINASLSIKAVSENDSDFGSTERIQGLNNAIIQMTGKDNIFRIGSKKEVTQVSLMELDLRGCNESMCADKGGLIYNKGYLSVVYSRLQNGQANQGGAIYNAGAIATNEYSSADVSYSLIEKNTANQGAILYNEMPFFSLVKSVLKNNKTVQNDAANIYTVGQIKDVENLAGFNAQISSNSFFKNKGRIANVIDGMLLNNLTLVDNSSQALYLNAPNGMAYIANSLILNNGTSDCLLASGDKTNLQNNLTSASCGVGDASYPNQTWSGSNLFAIKNGASEGQCLSLAEDNQAILCPYSVPENTFLGYFRPRILLNYRSIEDSPIVNKGLKPNETDALMVCDSADQRSVNRLTDNIYCDRGSIEITVPTTKNLVGQDILSGETAKFSVAEYLGDSDLIPKEQCKALVGDNPTGEAWQDGCLKIVQTKTESKGQTSIDINGNVVYKPNSAWHGADIFEIHVITSSTRFNTTKPYLVLTTQIVQSPKNQVEDKSVKTSGGAWGFAGLLGLFGLLGLRRVLKV
jgi:rhombotarget A family protien